MKPAVGVAVGGLVVTTIVVTALASGKSSEVPLWFTGSQSQIDQLRGSGMTEEEIDHWLDVAYDRVYKSLQPGQVVSWDPELGYYATMPELY